MDVCDENTRFMTKPSNFRGIPVGGGKFAAEMGNNRRPLRDIRNFDGAPPHPCADSKRGLSNKNAIDDTNPTLAGRRPMTRKYAASLASQSQPCHKDASTRPIWTERHNKPFPPIANSNSMDASTIIDVDGYKSSDDLQSPMVEEIEEMVDCEVEVEMEDVVGEPIPDIDSCDSDNPLAVVDYVEDIYNFYRRTETSGSVLPNYLSNQFDINDKMRAILIDWLIEVHYKFELMDETLFLTVNIIDRFLARQSVVRKKLQLVGVTAMLLACKYEEVSVPVVEDLILISDRAYMREEVLEMEKLMVNTLQFNMSVPTPYVFMRRFLKAAYSDKKLELLSFFIIELCLVEYQMLKFQPSLLAAAAIYTADCTLKGSKNWTQTSELYSKYSEDQLLECSRMMVGFHQNAGAGKLTGVHRKYSTSRFGYAAKSEAALFLLDSRL